MAVTKLLIPLAVAIVSTPVVAQAGGNQHAELDAATIYERVEDSVCLIQCYDTAGRRDSLGTGFILDLNGPKIVTNWHVLHGAARAEAKLSNGTVCSISGIVAAHEDQDIAIAEVITPPSHGGLEGWHQTSLEPLRMATSAPRPGDQVFAVGNPRGLRHTLSDGLISGIRGYGEGSRLQFTAPISPGSSGSPLLNSIGDVVGIVTSTLTNSQNLNFAAPIHQVENLEHGKLIPVHIFSGVDRPGDPYEQRALRLQNEGRIAELIDVATIGLSVDPHNTDLLLLIHAARRATDLPPDLNASRQSADLAPGHADVLMRLVEAYKASDGPGGLLSLPDYNWDSGVPGIRQLSEWEFRTRRWAELDPASAQAHYEHAMAVLANTPSLVIKGVPDPTSDLPAFDRTASGIDDIRDYLQRAVELSEADPRYRARVHHASAVFETRLAKACWNARLLNDPSSSELARAAYESSVELDHDRFQPWYDFGDFLLDPLMTLGSDREECSRHALKCFRECIRLAPERYEGHGGYGTALQALGRHEEAVTSLRYAISLNGTDPGVHATLGRSLLATGDRQGAMTQHARVKELGAIEEADRLFNLIFPSHDSD